MRLSVRTKLLGGFLAIVALMTGLSALALTQMSTIDTKVDTIANQRLPSVETIAGISSQIGTFRRRQMIYLLSPADQKASAASDLAATTATVNDLLKTYQGLVWSGQDQADFDAVSKIWSDYQTQSKDLVSLSDAGKNAEGFALLTTGAVDDTFGSLGTETTAWDKLNRDAATAEAAAAGSTYDNATILILGALVLAGFAALGLGLLLSRRISSGILGVQQKLAQITERGVTGLDEAMEALSRNDLTYRLEPTVTKIEDCGTDEIGETACIVNSLLEKTQRSMRSYETARTNLAAVIGEVRVAATTVARTSSDMNSAAAQAGSASGQVAQTINQVASGATDQARAASQTSVSVQDLTAIIAQVGAGASETTCKVDAAAAAIGEMTSAIASATDASSEVDRVSERVAVAAEQGTGAVRKSVDGMSRIKGAVEGAAGRVAELGAKSDQIGAIVDTINDIAEQTNLLALNAAIEAARAGEQGKGFAVVADEVRKLAERSSRATKEIAALIGEVQRETELAVAAMQTGASEVNAGTALADEAGASLEAISSAVSDTKSAAHRITGSVDAMRHASDGVVAASDAIAAIALQTNSAAARMGSAANVVSQSIESIAAVSEQNSAATQEVSAATEEMSAQAEELVASAESLAGMATDLEALVARFTLDASSASTFGGELNVSRGKRPAHLRVA